MDLNQTETNFLLAALDEAADEIEGRIDELIGNGHDVTSERVQRLADKRIIALNLITKVGNDAVG